MNCTQNVPAEATYFDQSGMEHQAVLSFVKNDGGICCIDKAGGIQFNIIITSVEAGFRAVIPLEEIRESQGCLLKTVTLFPGQIAGVEGDGGALVLPLDSGRLCHTSGKESAEYLLPHFQLPDTWQVSWSNMSLIGQYAGGTVKAGVIRGGQFDAKLRVRTNWGGEGLYSIDTIFFFRDFPGDPLMDEAPAMTFVEMSGDWKALAPFYRKYLLEERKLPTLEQKQYDNPALDHSARSLCIRCRMGVKPFPYQPYQTPENEPEPVVFMTFENIREVAAEFARQGVSPVEFQLVGWNHGGHDGAFPQLFPVEEAFGGEAELRKTIKYVKSLGYTISFHDSYHIGYLLADNFSIEDCCISRDGRPVMWDDADVLNGGTPYTVCPQIAADITAPANFRRCAELGVNGTYYTDIISIIGMHKCYGRHHGHMRPLSRRGNALCYKRILKRLQELFGVSMSEGARDWALPELDRCYEIQNCIEAPYPCTDELIPLYQLIFHGLLIYNCFRVGINSFPGEELYLRNLAWGGMPILYFHHLFHPEWTAETGWAKDLTFAGPEKLAADVARIKRISDDYAKLEHLRYVPISEIMEEAPKLSKTVYADGSVVWVNYSGIPNQTSDGTTVPPCDFIVRKP